MKSQRDYDDFDGRFIGFAAIAFSGFTIAACLLLLPMIHTQMDTWQVAIEAQLRDVRVCLSSLNCNLLGCLKSSSACPCPYRPSSTY